MFKLTEKSGVSAGLASDFLSRAPAGATVRGYEGEIEGIVIEASGGQELAIWHNDGRVEISSEGRKYWPADDWTARGEMLDRLEMTVETADLLGDVLEHSRESTDQWMARMVRECRTRQLIRDYIDVEYSAYCWAQIAVQYIALRHQPDVDAVAGGAQIGDWLLKTDDGYAIEVVRIVDWKLVSIYRRHEYPADWR